MFTGAQCRAARGLVDWTRDELAKAAKVSPETIKNIEHGVFRPQEETAQKIVRTFEMEGVEFTDDEGVRFRKDSVMRFEGSEGLRQFIDDVYKAELLPEAAIGGTKPVCVSSFDDRQFAKHLGDYYLHHAKRVTELKNVRVYVLVQEGPYHWLPEEKAGTGGFREYRKNPQKTLGNVPFYVYGDKLAIMVFEENQPPQIIVICSAPVAKTYREMFWVLWEAGTPCNKLPSIGKKK